jgi:hypothetical protein
MFTPSTLTSTYVNTQAYLLRPLSPSLHPPFHTHPHTHNKMKARSTSTHSFSISPESLSISLTESSWLLTRQHCPSLVKVTLVTASEKCPTNLLIHKIIIPLCFYEYSNSLRSSSTRAPIVLASLLCSPCITLYSQRLELPIEAG